KGDFSSEMSAARPFGSTSSKLSTSLRSSKVVIKNSALGSDEIRQKLASPSRVFICLLYLRWIVNQLPVLFKPAQKGVIFGFLFCRLNHMILNFGLIRFGVSNWLSRSWLYWLSYPILMIVGSCSHWHWSNNWSWRCLRRSWSRR